MSKKLHLDSEYRRRWELFELEDGTIEDSRLKNWREVEWGKVIKIIVHIQHQIHVIDRQNKANFQGFLNFRTFGKEPRYNEKREYIEHKTIQEWVIGWTDGINSFLKAIDFYTGNLVNEFTVPLEQVKGHIHPRIKDAVVKAWEEYWGKGIYR